MANLIERLTGVGGATNDKMPIHAFCGAFNEFRRGKLTGAELTTFFTLTAAQVTQAQSLSALLTAAPDKTEFMRVFKDMLYMGEAGTDTRYTNMTFYNTRLRAEVTSQGGTPP